MDLKSEKSRARIQAKVKRAYAHSPSAAIELIKHFPAQRFRGQTIGVYWPIQSELDLTPIMQALHDMGETLALPAITRKNHPLVFRRWTKGDILKHGPHNTREPFPDKDELFPDILLMPLLAFTAKGERLGYGGGYYDRTLEALNRRKNVFACGVAYAAQEAVSLPTGPHDMKLDAMLTETGFREF